MGGVESRNIANSPKTERAKEPNIKGSLWLVSGLRWSERMVVEAVSLLQSLLLACSLSCLLVVSQQQQQQRGNPAVDDLPACVPGATRG